MGPLGGFGTQTVTVLRAPQGRDSHGNLVRAWDQAATHDLTECLLVPVAGTELVLNRDEVTTTWALYASPDADLLDTDRVRTDDGTTYEVVGSVLRYQAGVLDHAQALLTRWEG